VVGLLVNYGIPSKNSRKRLHVSETYTKKSEVDTLRSEMDKRFDRLEQMIARLYDKIDAKADK